MPDEQSRGRVFRALDFEGPDRPPRHLWTLPGVPRMRAAEHAEVLARFPGDVTGPPSPYGRPARVTGTPNEVGAYTDEWGCVWSVAEPGVIGEVKHPPLADWSAFEAYAPPDEMLDGWNAEPVQAWCATAEGFRLAGTTVRPFERMQFLRGTENLLMDIAMESEAFLALRDMVHGFGLRDFELWATTDVDALSFMDDWGTQQTLLINPELWRKHFKPMYREYCEIAKAAGKKVFMHSDGHIESIMGDLVEIGVDALNSQLFCMDVDRIAERHKGRIAFWGEIDRQHILPFGTVEEVEQAVRRVADALYDPAGGIIAQCEWGIRDPKENIEAVFATWDAVAAERQPA
jgi:hypothetical protein